jgi:glycosyltransferase involved in cell wall biosynthesis
MKIVHVVYSLEMGGAEMLVAQLCRIQRSQGHDVSVCAYSMLGAVGEMLRQEGFTIHVAGEAHPALTAWRYFRLFRRMRPDVVHCHNVAPTLQAAVSARVAGSRLVLSTRHSLVAPPYNRSSEAMYNVVATACDFIVGICQITCANLRGTTLAHRGKIRLVYNGSPPITRVKTPARATLELLFVGRMAEVKDLGTLVRAVALAAERLPQLRLSVVGDGIDRVPMAKLAAELGVADRIRFCGQQLETDGYFSAADVFVMSSVSEGLPMSLLQAMSIGVPAITTDVGGMAEILRECGSGLLVPVGDSAAMADAMVRLANDPALCAQLGARAMTAYQARFTLDRMVEGYTKLYHWAEKAQ